MSHVDLGSRVIRPSSLSTYADCPRRYAATHLGGIVQEAGYNLEASLRSHIGAAVGTAVHAGAAYTLEYKLHHGDDLGNAIEAEERADAALKAEVQFAPQWDETTASLSTAQQQVRRMVRSYRKHLAPTLTPLIVEERLEVDVGGGWRLSGQMDGVMAGDPSEQVRDLKTGTRRRANGLQYGAYAVILHSHGHPIRSIVEDYLARVRLDREQPPPQAFPVEVAPAAQEAWETIAAIKSAADEFTNLAADASARPPHLAFRANPASGLCSQRFCKAWGTTFCTIHAK